MRVREDLDFHVAGLFDQLLNVKRVVAEGSVGFPACCGEGLSERGGFTDGFHPDAAATCGRLDQHRKANAPRRRPQCIVRLIGWSLAWNHWNLGTGHERPGTSL